MIFFAIFCKVFINFFTIFCKKKTRFFRKNPLKSTNLTCRTFCDIQLTTYNLQLTILLISTINFDFLVFRMKKETDSRLKKAGVTGYNKPKRTPNHPTKSHIVVAKEGDTIKTI